MYRIEDYPDGRVVIKSGFQKVFLPFYDHAAKSFLRENVNNFFSPCEKCVTSKKFFFYDHVYDHAVLG